jgi:hypothetical protein
MDLTEAQALVVGSLYATAIPLFVVLLLALVGWLPRWVLITYLLSFAVCALGWEVWYTYGLVDGQPVDARRPPEMNAAIPIHLNWVLTSLFDAAVCGVGLLLMWAVHGFRDTAFRRWTWASAIVLLVWFVGQNVYVEYMIHAQVNPEWQLSWAPLIPTGPWLNPVLFEIDGREITFQTQLPWLLMVPLFMALVIWTRGRWGDD